MKSVQCALRTGSLEQPALRLSTALWHFRTMAGW